MFPSGRKFNDSKSLKSAVFFFQNSALLFYCTFVSNNGADSLKTCTHLDTLWSSKNAENAAIVANRGIDTAENEPRKDPADQ